MSLTFKKGSLTSFNKSDTKFNADDFCFVIYDETNKIGTIRIMADDQKNYFKLMPDPGTNNDVGKVLVSKGASSSPVYEVLSVAGGGTGKTTFDKANRVLYISSNQFQDSEHYVDKNTLIVNGKETDNSITVNTTFKFAVNGPSTFKGGLYGFDNGASQTNVSKKTPSYGIYGWKEIEAVSLIANTAANFSTDKTGEIKDSTGMLLKDSLGGFRVRIDSNVPATYSQKWAPPSKYLINNATAVLSINRYSNLNNITQIGFTPYGLLFR
jgi:hypothetical protein